MSSSIFAYLCPKCKTPNPNSVTYCVKCGHWLLDSNFPAVPLAEKEYYKMLKGDKKRSLIFPVILYILFAIIFVLMPIEAKVLLSLVIVLYGIINIIIPIRRLLIKKRLVGVAILFVGIVTLVASSFSMPANPAIINLPQYKTQCITVQYDSLARETEKYVNTKVKLNGQIIQVQEIANRLVLRVNITKDEFTYKDTIWVNYTLKTGEKHFLENDIIDLWGNVKGRRTYKTVLGNQITIPEVDAVSIERNK